MYLFKFHMDKRGHGKLLLLDDDNQKMEYTARSGSINAGGYLVNNLNPGVYYIMTLPMMTDEPPMVFDGFGWKARLFTTERKYTRLLIHPDAGKPGTDGCVGIIGTHARPLFDRIREIMKDQPEIPVYVTMELN
jgi:hypothetical protein